MTKVMAASQARSWDHCVGRGRTLGLSPCPEVVLRASVWSSDHKAAREVAARIQAGTVGTTNTEPSTHGSPSAAPTRYGLDFRIEGLNALGVPRIVNG